MRKSRKEEMKTMYRCGIFLANLACQSDQTGGSLSPFAVNRTINLCLSVKICG